MKINDPSAFFSRVRTELFSGVLTEPQVQGINAILDTWPDGTDPRWAAYALATAYHETGKAMEPVPENRGRPYGHPPAKYWQPDGPYGNVYYGRGLVQLTWLANYRRAESEIPGSDLVRVPDNALKDNVAAEIMVRGMTDGWFTGRKLADFFNARMTDWTNARTIINGHDCAAQIAAYAVHFSHAMT